MIKRICLTALTILPTACSNPDIYVPETVDDRRTAVILGPPQADGKRKKTYWINTVTSIDGKQVAAPLGDTVITPGKHRLTLSCKRSKKIVLDATVELEAIAGVRYEVAVDHGRQSCVIVRSRRTDR